MTHSSILTSQLGSGPVKTLDLSTLPDAVTHRIIRAAIAAVHHIDNCDVDVAQDGDKETAASMDELSFAIHALDKLEKPTVPGAQLFAGVLSDSYEVVRDGVIRKVALTSMTKVEIEAAITRLRWQAQGELRHAELLGQNALGTSVGGAA